MYTCFKSLPGAPRRDGSRARHGGGGERLWAGEEEARADGGGRRGVPGTADAAVGWGTLAALRCA